MVTWAGAGDATLSSTKALRLTPPPAAVIEMDDVAMGVDDVVVTVIVVDPLPDTVWGLKAAVDPAGRVPAVKLTLPVNAYTETV